MEIVDHYTLDTASSHPRNFVPAAQHSLLAGRAQSNATRSGDRGDASPRSSGWAMHAFTSIITLVFCLGTTCRADDNPGKTREEIQRELNAAVMATPFNPGDVKKAEAYAEQANKTNVAPTLTPPSYWSPGWTCANLTTYAYYNYGDYQNCIYYHHYYGRYW